MPATVLAMLCPMTAATVPLPDAQQRGSRPPASAVFSDRREQLRGEHEPEDVHDVALRERDRRPTAAQTPTPSRISAGIATAKNVSGNEHADEAEDEADGLADQHDAGSRR